MKKSQAYENYKNFAKYVDKSNLRILSGRYKFVEEKYNFIFKDILEKLSISKFDDIFDIGTGDGKIISYLSKKCKSATTIDSSEIIKKISQKKNITYLKGNIHKEAKKITKKFDKILVYSVVQYFQNLEEVIKFIKICLRMLKKTGAILIGDIPNKDMNLRYLNSPEYKKKSKIFEKKKRLSFSNLDKKFFSLDVGKNIVFTDKKLLFLLKKFNTTKYESYLLPQKKELPYSDKRIDLLILKRS